ncbi:glycosyltransferase [Tessaracoccus rhinocerotis]|nr:glycosyltransferase [Tessaracoccus rhinocerotis]
MCNLATGLLVYGERDRNSAIELGIEGKRITIVGNAVGTNATVWDDQSSQEAFVRVQESAIAAERDGRLVLVHSGRLTESKRPEVLLEAVGLLRDKFPLVHLHVIGDGPCLPDLQRHENARYVTFHGPIYDSGRLQELIQSAAMVVSPFNMGLLALDALRAGVPVLLPDHPSSGPEVDALTIGVNAREFSAGDAASLADQATQWVRQARDISESDFVDARSQALKASEPARVAEALIQACVHATEAAVGGA